MPKFRPIAVVDAEQWKGPVELRKDEAVPEPPAGLTWVQRTDSTRYLVRETVGGVEKINAGDWLIRNSAGQVVPMADGAFRQLYEPVDLHAESVPPVDMRFTIGPGCVTPEEPKPS